MREIFVFGSNMAGRHGKGAAKEARLHHGAIYGIAEGLQGNSYAIPTKKTPWQTREFRNIANSVSTFIEFAKQHSDWTFNVTPIGCGLAGYTPELIAPLFKDVPDNVKLPPEFIDCLL